MSYTKLNFVNGSVPALSAANLNHMETGISDAHDGIASLETDLAAKADSDTVNAAIAEKADNLTLSVSFDENDVPLYCTTNTTFSGGAFAKNAARVKYAYIYSTGSAEIQSGAFAGCTSLTDIYTNLSSLTVQSGAYPSDVDPTIHYEADFEIINRIIKALIYLGDNKADSATTLAGYGITDAYTQDETDTLLTSKADSETGSGDLSPGTNYTDSAGTFIYAKSGNVCSVTIHMSAFTSDVSYISMSGLPYKAATAVSGNYPCIVSATSSRSTVSVKLDGTRVALQRLSGSFTSSETLTVTITYIIS